VSVEPVSVRVAPNTIGDLLIEQHLPYLTNDLEDYLRAIGTMFAEADAFVGFDAEEEGWSALLDPDTCPANGLPHLAMYVGERLPTGLEEADQREWIRDAPNQIRGTLASIIYAAQRTLTGSRTVSLQERSGVGQTHPEDYITVRTYISETPDEFAVLDDLREVVPADIELDYETTPGQTWNQMQSTSPTWNDVLEDYDSWDDAVSTLDGFVTIGRPRPF